MNDRISWWHQQGERVVRFKHRVLASLWHRFPTVGDLVDDFTDVRRLGANIRWYFDLFAHFGSRAAVLVRRSDARSLSKEFRTWSAEVDHCVDVPLDDPDGEWITFLDYEATIGTRQRINRRLAVLPADLCDAVERWLTAGADGRFVDLTEPDVDRLLRRADLVSRAPIQPWDARVPKRGLVRVALENAARRHDSETDENLAIDDAALWSADEGDRVRAVAVDLDFAVTVLDQEGRRGRRILICGYRRRADGWERRFAELADDGAFSTPALLHTTGWNNGIAWAVGREQPRAQLVVRYREENHRIVTGADGWWSFIRAAPDDITKPGVIAYDLPTRVG